MNNMKILVFMSDNRPLDKTMENANYPSLAASINSHYCKKFGYDFFYYQPYLHKKATRKNKTIKTMELEKKGFTKDNQIYNCIDPNTKETRHAAWSKILSGQKALRLSYDYVVYIDSDCIFKKAKSIEEFIKPYHQDILFLNNKPFNHDKPCSGFFILKNNAITKQFLKDWYHVQLPEKNKIHPWEQDGLWTMYKPYNIGLIDEWMFVEKKGQMLRHVDLPNRIPYFKTFMQKHDIPFAKDITVIPFSTKKIDIK